MQESKRNVRNAVWGPVLAVTIAAACTVGDGTVPDFSSNGGTAVSSASSDGGASNGDSGAGVDASADGTTSDGESTTAASGVDATTAPTSTLGGTTGSSGGGSASDTTTRGATSDGTATDGGVSSDSAGVTTTDGGVSGSSSDGGVIPGDAYEPCNPDATCDQPGEVCLEAGVGGFCTTTCNNVAMCPDSPPGTAIVAGCEFLLGFPGFEANYCGMIGCNFIFNDCPAGMTCTPVVMGLTVCEWT